MADVFQNISELSSRVGSGVNASIKIDDILPTVNNSARKYIIPWIGEIYTDIKAKAIPDYTPEDNAVLVYIQDALAHFTMYEYSFVGSVRFSGNGLVRSETETTKGAYKYQENNYKDYMIENGYELLEELILFIEANKDDYLKWTGSIREKSIELFINTASEFRELYSPHITRRTFEILRPLIVDLEEFAICEVMGEELFDDLKAKILAGDTNDKEKKAIDIANKALCSFAIREGIKRMWVRLEGEKVISNERGDSQSTEYERLGLKDQLEVLAKSDALMANRYITKLVKYLDNNADDFTGWPIQMEEEEETTTTDLTTNSQNSKIISI